MRHLGLLLALAGLGLAILLIAMQDLAAVAGLLGTAGLGLVLLVPAHLPFLLANSWAWALVLPRRSRPGFAVMVHLNWLRGAINALLPVGRVGGEIACYRLLRRRGVAAPPAAGGLLVDMAISVLSQMGFALLGLALLLLSGRVVGWGVVVGVLLGAAVLAAPFIALQNAGAFGRVAGWLNRLSAGRLPGLAAESLRIDRFLRRIWRRPRVLAWCFAWQMIGCVLGALQIWLALWLMDTPVSLLDAVIIEALVQAVLAFGFVVPAGLGVMEAGFLGVGLLMGLDAPEAAALALTRRFWELLLYLPGLAAWAWEERQPA